MALSANFNQRKLKERFAMTASSKAITTAVLCLLCVGGSAGWIYWREFKAPQHDVELHRRVGEIMAEQTVRVAGASGKIVLIAIPTGGFPELKSQLDGFRLKLKTLGQYDLREYELDPKDQDKYGLGTGLSGRRYVRTANKNLDAAAIVSFVGAPNLKDEVLVELQKVPKLVAEARTIDHLPRLFSKNLISVAVASRFNFPAPAPLEPKTAQDRFDKRYQVVAADSIPLLSKPE